MAGPATDREPVLTEIPEAFLDQQLARRLIADGTVLFGAMIGDGTVTWLSDSSNYLLGAPPERFIGLNALDMLHPDDGELLLETLGESARGAEERIRVALRVRHADGHWVSLEVGGMDLREADGSGLFLVWGSPNESTGRLLGFMRSLLAGDDQDRLLNEIVAWNDSTAPGTHSAVLVRLADGSFRCRARSAELPDELALDIPADGGPAGPWTKAIDQRTTSEWSDLSGLDDHLRTTSAAHGYLAVWAVPVVVPGHEHPQALLLLWRTRPGPSLATHRRQIEHIIQVIRLAIEWSVVQRDLVTAATTDPLTGLANRAQLNARIRADRSNLAGLLFCDLDDFKAVNDRHGHLVGDRILGETARRMADAVRPTDLLVRLGGDEFAVWCPDLRSPLDAERVADRLIATLDVPIEIDGHVHPMGCSIGVAVVGGGEGFSGDIDRLLGEADEALYRAKRAGKGQWASAYAPDQPLPFPDQP